MTLATPNRRTLLGALALGVAGVTPARAEDARVDLAKLMAAPPLPDLWMGSPDAPTTVVEYASMTCTHCAAFSGESWPRLKRDWVDAGKVRYALREFPLDPLAAAAAMLARSRGPERRQAMVELLFAKQAEWAFVDGPVEALAAVVAQAGIDRATFDATLRDEAAYKATNDERDAAARDLGVTATPTFFVNGLRHPGEVKPEDLGAVFG